MMGIGRIGKWIGLVPPPVLPAREAYALWAHTYPPRPHNRVMEVEQAVMAPLLASIGPKRALDVGTGTGRNLPLLAAAGARTIVGLDLSMAMLTHGLPGPPRICADALRLPLADRAFDLVCSSLMVGDVENLGAWIAEVSRVLNRGGHLVYSDFHPAWAARGWRRTFRTDDGREFELDYFPHTMNQHLDQLSHAGLAVRTVREPRVQERAEPVVVLFHAVKR